MKAFGRNPMSLVQIACLILYAAGMALGQVLFKLTTESIGSPNATTFTGLLEHLLKLAFNPFFILAIFLYLSLSVFWVWILSFTPLARAYPFAALAILFTLIIGVFFFKESVSRTHLFGFAMLIGGIILIARE